MKETSKLFEYVTWKSSSITFFVLINPVDVEMFQWITEKFDLLVALHGNLTHIKRYDSSSGDQANTV